MNNLDNFVAHPVFGEGIVEDSRWDGAELKVTFRSGLSLWLPTKWFKPISIKQLKLDQISSKRLLEAFRLGIVPHQDIEYFTFGRGYEIAELESGLAKLKEGSGNVYIVEGTYGSGKTHLLEYFRHLSLKKGFVTSYCELNTQETPLHRPKRVYRALMHSLRYIQRHCEYTYRDLLRMMSKIKINDHCFLTPVLKHLRQLDNSDLKSEVFWQWIEGESTKDYATDPLSPFRVRGGQRIPALYDFSTATDFYTYILTGLSYLINQAGFGGLVIILDEVETITHVWEYHAYNRGLNFLEGFLQSPLNNEELKRIGSRMIHNRVRPTPYIYADPHIMLVLASTPIHGLRGFEHLKELIENKLVLRKFIKTELEIIFNNLFDVYQCAYNEFSLEISQKENIFNAAYKRSYGELREFIKFTVEAFDWFRLGRAN